MPRPGERPKEEYAWILDYLPSGRSDDPRPIYKREPIAIAVGEKYFVLMELVPKPGKIPQPHQRVYIGDGERDLIDHVKRRLKYDELTPTAKSELPYVLQEIVLANESRFMDVLNKAPPLSSRVHTLSLLPGLGKKLLIQLLEERSKSEFKSFEDLKRRVKGLRSPEKIIGERIEQELRNESERVRLFVPR